MRLFVGSEIVGGFKRFVHDGHLGLETVLRIPRLGTFSLWWELSKVELVVAYSENRIATHFNAAFTATVSRPD